MATKIDYTNKDYASLRQAMFDLARFRLPEWTDRSPADLGVLLVDLFAYMGDIILYYQDRIAGESFLHTATERRSVLQLLRLIGYELCPPIAASADLKLTFKPVPLGGASLFTIPHGSSFSTRSGAGAPVSFEYLGPTITLDLRSDQVSIGADGKPRYLALPVRQCKQLPTETIGSSTGEPNQSFKLSQGPLLLESLEIEVNEGSGWVRWDRRDSLLYDTAPDGRAVLSDAESRDYYVQIDEEDRAFVMFGDGVYGRVPPRGINNVRAAYRVGGGAVGNVPAGAISDSSLLKAPTLLESVTNPKPAAGGADHETIDHAVRFGPLAFRSTERAVTLSDYIALAHKASGVAKVRARSVGWNRVQLFVAPEGDSLRSVPEDLKLRLIAFFEDKRMAGTFVDVLDAVAVPIDVSVEVIPNRRYRAEAVRQAAEDAVKRVLAFDRVDFGQPVYLSDIYAALEAAAEVEAVTVTLFRRKDSPAKSFEEELDKFNLPGLDQLPEFFRRSVRVDIASGGYVAIGEFEIALLGDLEVTLREVAR